MTTISFVILLLCFKQTLLEDPPCVIDLECSVCLPENMPLVTSHRVANGSVRVTSGSDVALSCGSSGKFVVYPHRHALAASCERGRYRVHDDHELRHLLELGCQESIFEDVLHQVDECLPPLHGRAYRMPESNPRLVRRHLATVCFDHERGVAVRLRMSNEAPAQPTNLQTPTRPAIVQTPLSMLGNIHQILYVKMRHEAEKLYSDEARMNKRLRELFKHDKYSFAVQTLTSAKLLSGQYFEDQYMRVTNFVSNKVAVWRSVARGNLLHVHRDVAKLLRQARARAELHVYSGTHGVLALRAGRARTELFLTADGRYPVPRYVWSVVHAPALHKALALVVLNDPFVAVSEIRQVVFCQSECGTVSWLHELRRHRNYEVPLYGLVFCCTLDNFTSIVTEMTTKLNVFQGNEGMLTEFSF